MRALISALRAFLHLEETIRVLTVGVANQTAKPASAALVPYRVAAASISSSSKNNAAQVQPHGAAPPSLLPRQVPLPSQEGTKGIVQYALYVCSSSIYTKP